MHTVTQIKEHLIGMGHGGTLNKVRNIEAMLERSAAKFLLKTKPITVIRTAALSSLIHDDFNVYASPSDFLSLIDLIPQDNRTLWDKAVRNKAGDFDLKKAIKNRVISIESDSAGGKQFRINWKSRAGKVLNAADSLTGNGTWSATGAASGVELDTIYKKSGAGSIRFDITATGGGIDNDDMTAVDLTDEDEVADVFVWVYLPAVSALTSITGIWGNDLTTKYWTSTAQTAQADGTAFKIGWNIIKFSWAGATETGTVAPATIDSFRITFATTGAIANVRMDNIIFSIGRAFDCKYYSKFLFINSAGAWISRTTTDDDNVAVDNDALPMYLFECLKDMAHQMEGTDSAFDINYARQELQELFPHFNAENPNQSKKVASSYASTPRFRR